MNRIVLLVFLTSCSPSPSPKIDYEPTYTKHIRPIFVNRCANCHHAGYEGSNWLIYKDSYNKRSKIKERVVINRTMPVGFIAEEERRLIGKWVDTGAKE